MSQLQSTSVLNIHKQFAWQLLPGYSKACIVTDILVKFARRSFYSCFNEKGDANYYKNKLLFIITNKLQLINFVEVWKYTYIYS